MNKSELFKEWIDKILVREYNRNIWTRLICLLKGVRRKTETISESIDFYEAYTAEEIREEIRAFEKDPDGYIRKLKEGCCRPHPAQSLIR